MIIIDNETTSLVAPDAAPIEQQPYVTEFAAIKLDERYSPVGSVTPELLEVGRYEFLCKPRIPIPAEVEKITGITNSMVAKCPPFVHFLPGLIDFFLGERVVVAHNLPFDIAVLRYELARLSRVTSFPWPPRQICTVEISVQMAGYRMNLGALHKELTGKEHADAHRAMPDVEALVRVVKVLRKKGLL